jgi:uncharacterized protein YndB with AHSA1/START domain
MNATLDTAADQSVLRFERRLAHPVEKVWRAITDPAELTRWFPQDIEGSFTPGASLRFVFRGEPPTLGGEVIADFRGEVLEIDPPRLLAYSWGEDVLRWTLTPDGAGCLLVFTDTISERGKAARDGAGWHVCLDGLQALLAGPGAAAPPGGGWQELYASYTQAFGPEAATAPLPT